jgi:hypothetical protein
MPTQKTLRILGLLHKHGDPVNLQQLFSDTSNIVTDAQIIRERRQEIGGQTFIVSRL